MGGSRPCNPPADDGDLKLTARHGPGLHGSGPICGRHYPRLSHSREDDPMDDLVQFLRARLDEDEVVARGTTMPLDWHQGPGGDDPEWVSDEMVLMWPPEFHTPYEQDKHWRGLTADPAGLAAHIARHDPARVLREVEAKRGMVDAYLPPRSRPPPGTAVRQPRRPRPCRAHQGQGVLTPPCGQRTPAAPRLRPASARPALHRPPRLPRGLAAVTVTPAGGPGLHGPGLSSWPEPATALSPPTGSAAVAAAGRTPRTCGPSRRRTSARRPPAPCRPSAWGQSDGRFNRAAAKRRCQWPLRQLTRGPGGCANTPEAWPTR